MQHDPKGTEVVHQVIYQYNDTMQSTKTILMEHQVYMLFLQVTFRQNRWAKKAEDRLSHLNADHSGQLC